jgi:hypothetical protein
MEQKFDIFNQVDKPVVMLCTPNLIKVHAIDNLIFETKVILRYNAISEFSFSIPESIDGNATTLFVYDLIKTKKYLHIENIGYFIIQDVDENDEGLVKIKEVKCESLESELKNKQMIDFKRVSIPIVDSLINVQYKLIPADLLDPFTDFEYELYPNDNKVIYSYDQGEGIIDILTENYCQNWSLDLTKPIPNSLIELGGSSNTDKIAVIVRGFKVSSTNVYNFLINDVEKAFSCVVIFSKTERKFWLETMESVEETNIFLSFDNLIKQGSVSEYSDEIATSLSCYGESNFSINYANPLGTSKIYNFDYFKTTEWMSQDLIDKIDDWKTAIQKEINGTVGGSHPGEAWNTITWTAGGELCRSLTVLYFCRRQLSDYYYTYYRRVSEIAGQYRLAASVEAGSHLYKIYKNNVVYLDDPLGGATLTDTLNFYSSFRDTQEIITYSLGSSPVSLTTGFFQPLVPRNIKITTTPAISGKSFTIHGTNYLDATILETEVTGVGGTAETNAYFKTISQIDFPAYNASGDIAVLTGTGQDLRPSEAIEAEYQLKNIYQWSTAGTLESMPTNMQVDLHEIPAEEALFDLKNMASSEREAYSNLVEYLFKTYDDISRNNTGITFLENLIAEQEVLMATAIELSDDSKKEDHQTNINYIRNLFINKYEEVGYAGIPSEDNVSGYVLNSNQNMMSIQSFIDNNIIPGTKTDELVVDKFYSVGGLYQALGDNLSLEKFIDDLIGEDGAMTYISEQLSLETFFGSSLYQELLPFLIENTYQNEYAVNFSNDIKDKVKSSQELYTQSQTVLEKISSPRYEISLDLINFINLYEYKDSFTKELNLGKKVKVNIKNSIMDVVLLELEYSLDELDNISMTFGNRLRLDDVRFQYTDFIGQVQRTGSNVSFESSSWSNFDENYEDKVALLEENVRKVRNIDDIKLDSFDIKDQTFEISITKGGLMVRKKLDDENYYAKQLLLTNGIIAYTNDDWNNILYK